MGDSTPLWKGGIITETERVFYVIRSINYDGFTKIYKDLWYSYGNSLDDATQFSTFDAVVDAYAKRSRAWMDLKYEIIKVTRKTTNSLPTRRVLGELEAAPEGAVVKYALQNPIPRNRDYFLKSVSEKNGTYGTLDEAELFNSHEALVKEITRAARSQEYGLQISMGVNIVRVAIIPGGFVSNDTLTVLP